jgi:hypothetical protein
MATLNTPVSFAIGDVVTFSHPYLRQDPDRSQEQMVITDSELTESGAVHYGVDGEAWFNFEDLELVERATEESLAKALEMGDDYETDGEDEDDEF